MTPDSMPHLQSEIERPVTRPFMNTPRSHDILKIDHDFFAKDFS
jgi:hypothetical protein